MISDSIRRPCARSRVLSRFGFFVRHPSGGSGGNTLTVNISKKEVAEELAATYRVRFDYDAATTRRGYLRVKLHADGATMWIGCPAQRSSLRLNQAIGSDPTAPCKSMCVQASP
ncbi:hypothetical protein [Paraburkholderia sp. CI3]|uniref:hypothetical protein n=1 Tax=Paraburkholderia sp. CI3 TaxID=2991060 RepID=UPI003D236D30